MAEHIVIVRGGGDLATGAIQKLWHAGFKVLVLETSVPLAIRRTVALCSCIYSGCYTVEDMTAEHIHTLQECESVWAKGNIPVFVDPDADAISYFSPVALIDAIIAKKNIGTTKNMAPITVALGPGFTAGKDADVVIETMRGHRLGKLILEGSAMANTGVPGILGGESVKRVIHSPTGGTTKLCRNIGDKVQKEDVLFYVDDTPVHASLDGILRGLISNNIQIPKGLKSADIDPRGSDKVDCFTISDKARALGGAVLDAVFYIGHKNNCFNI